MIRCLMGFVCLISVALLLPIEFAVAATLDYDHTQHGFELDGAHRLQECGFCHVDGVFANTPRYCGDCHDGSGKYAVSYRSVEHPPTTTQCQACHITASWSAVVQVDHFETIGSCTDCHNSTFADGLPVDHTPTNAQCNSCHIDLSWHVTQFDHAEITADCVGCHNGVEATGKSAQHIQTTDVCDDCHTTAAWTPAVFDHAAVTPGTCLACHDGITAAGKHSGHFQTNAECDLCHSTVAWLPAIFDHAEVAPESCSSCHDNVTAEGMGADHFQSMLECDSCHTSTAWQPDFFAHTSPLYPGDHAGGLACTECHLSNSDAVTYTSPSYQPDCAGCHANDFERGPHKQYENPDTHYTVSELRDCTGACHIYTDASLGDVKEFRPGPEHNVRRNEW